MPPTKITDTIEDPLSRTNKYRKIIKPQLEKRRRDKQNAFIDQMRDIMFVTPRDKEQASKMEKTKVLEMGVSFMRHHQHQNMLGRNPAVEMEKFREGFSLCAASVNRCLASAGVDIATRSKVMSLLGQGFAMDPPKHSTVPLTVRPVPHYPAFKSSSSPSSDGGYESDRTPSPPSSEPVWRPF